VGTTCVEAEIVLVEWWTYISTQQTTKNCVATFPSQPGNKYNYSVKAQGFAAVFGVFEQKAVSEQVNITLVGSSTLYTLKLVDNVFKAGVVGATAELKCGVNTTKSRSNAQHVLEFNTTGLTLVPTCIISVTDPRFELLELNYAAALDSIMAKPLLAVQLNITNKENRTAEGVKVDI